MTIKLIAIDIDGTLLNEKHQLAPATIEAITAARNKGVKVVLTTGRPLSGVSPYLKQLNISGNEEYAITFNGAMVQTLNGKVILNHTLSFDDFLQTEMLSRKLKVHYQIETTDKIYVTNKDQSPYTTAEGYLVRLPIEYKTPEEFNEQMLMSKAMYVDYPEVIERIKKQIPATLKDSLYVVQSEPYFIEIMNKAASKGNALKGLAESLHLTAYQVMAIGDNDNDLTMIKYAGTGVAMGNGMDDVKNAAQFVTKTNKEDGVAYAIQKYVLA